MKQNYSDDPFKIPKCELEEEEERRTNKKLKDMTLEHIHAANERFKCDMENCRSQDAYHESRLVLEWIHQYNVQN